MEFDALSIMPDRFTVKSLCNIFLVPEIVNSWLLSMSFCAPERNLKLEARRGILSKILDRFALYRMTLKISALGENELQNAFNRIHEYFVQIKNTFPSSPRDLRKAYAVVVTAVILLSYVYLYLTGCGGWDGFTADSSGSLDYRDTYISIVLFQGAYVWIKFREVAFTKPVPTGAVRTVVTTSKEGRTKVKYEPRFKPRKEDGISFNWIYLGQFETRADAEVVYRIAASCYNYGKCYGTPLDLGDGREFTIIPEFTAEEQTLSGMQKVACVKERVKTVYECYKTQKDARNLSPTLPGASLEQELQNRRLQSEVVSQQQQKHDLALQLHHSQVQIQNLQLHVGDLQRRFRDLQQGQQLQVPNLQPQLQDLKQQQRDAEWLSIDEIWARSVSSEPIPGDLQQAHQLQLQHLQQQQQREEEWLSIDEIWTRLVPSEPIPENLQQAQQQGLEQVQQFQFPNLQPQLQLQHLQQQQREAEWLSIDEIWARSVSSEPIPEDPQQAQQFQILNVQPQLQQLQHPQQQQHDEIGVVAPDEI